MNYKNIFKIAVVTLSVLLYSCGEGVVEVGPETYTPKIVIEGFLEPGNIAGGILITRNVPLNTEINPDDAILRNALVTITDLQTNVTDTLRFDTSSFTFNDYVRPAIMIDYEKSYRLDVSAEIDGKMLHATSVTKVPGRGFRILAEESVLGTMKYREKDNEGNVKKFKIVFEPSAGSSFYAISNIARDATFDNFVYDNPYFEIERKDLEENFNQFKFQMRWLQNVNPAGGKREYEIDWLDLWFYSRYDITVYACDENFRLYLQTHDNVQEFDGNFHEPRTNITGDGIGVFGSYIEERIGVTVER